MTRSRADTPVHVKVYRALRERILFGRFEPGQPVTIQGLVTELQCGMTPVREAVRRLTAEGALEFQGNRRICVPLIDEKQYGELIFARLAIETELAVRAASNMPEEGIADLQSIDQLLDQAMARGDVVAYMQHNHHFHFALYRQARSTVLLPLAEMLWLRHGPLLRTVCRQYGTRNLVDRHEEALNALRTGDVAAVGKAIGEDIEQGMKIVLESQDWRVSRPSDCRHQS